MTFISVLDVCKPQPSGGYHYGVSHQEHTLSAPRRCISQAIEEIAEDCRKGIALGVVPPILVHVYLFCLLHSQVAGLQALDSSRSCHCLASGWIACCCCCCCDCLAGPSPKISASPDRSTRHRPLRALANAASHLEACSHPGAPSSAARSFKKSPCEASSLFLHYQLNR